MPADKRIHRLEDLLVEEVSIVDKPANKRRFLAVKSEDGMGDRGPEITTDAAGNLVSDPPVSSDLDPSPVVLTPELAERFAAVGKGLEDVEKRLSIDPEMRRGIFRELGDAMGRLQSVLATTDVARIDRGEGGSTLVPILGAELSEIAKVLGIMARKLTSTGTKKGEDPPTPAADEGAKLLEELVRTVETAVEKRGAKMGKGRLVKFREAMQVLQGILTELDNQFPPGAKAPPFPPKPGGKRPPNAPPPQKAAKAEGVAELPGSVEKAFTGLTSTVEKLTGIVKSQGKALHDLRARPGSSNVIPVERTCREKSDADDDVHWPLDMNDEKTRETVDKSISFLK